MGHRTRRGRHELRADGIRDRFGKDAIDGRARPVVEVPVQRVPDRVYEEARAVKARRAVNKLPSIVDRLPSIVDAPAMPLELAEEAD